MHCATLKACALNRIVSHLCSITTRKEKIISQNLVHSLTQDGIYEMFAKLIFQKMVDIYPLLVSNRLLEICCHGYLKEIDLKKCWHVSLAGLTKAVKSCPNLERLNLSECNQLVCKDLIHMLHQHAKKLICLKLDFCKTLTDELLQLIIQLLPQLAEFSCEGCTKLTNLQLQNIPLHKISAPLNHLTTVNLSGCQELNCTFIRHLTSVTRSNLKSLNVSSTSIDCIALVYLSGYSLSSAVTIATKLKTKMAVSSQPCCVLELQESNDDDVFREAGDNTESNPFDPELGYVETVSDYVKKMCAYCSHDLAARQFSGNTDSMNIYSITESYEDYDIVDSQVVNVIESDFGDGGKTGEGVEDLVAEISGGEMLKGSDLEWAVLSIKDVSLGNKCTCSDQDSDEATSSSSLQEERDETEEKRTSDKIAEPGLYGSSDCKPIFSPNITSLDISSTSFYDTGFYELDVVKECFLLFLVSNKNVKTLHMSWASEEIGDEMIRLIAEKQPQMESLSLAGCSRISNSGLREMAGKLDNLKALDIAGVSFVTDDSLFPLVTKHTELQQLYLAESALTDRVLNQISTALCNSIRHLDLSWCENITDEGAVKLLSSCPLLTYLDLRQCEISAHALRAITQHGKNLSVIGLNGIRGLNDTICVEMVKNLPRLHRVDFSWNTSITDESISALCQSCPLLREVVISGLKRITSKPFLPIISGLSDWRHRREKILSRLYSQMSPNTYVNVKERDVANLEALEADFYLPFRCVNYVPVLRKLTLGYCDKVNDNHLAEITAVCRGTLQIEDYYGALIKAKWSDVKK